MRAAALWTGRGLLAVTALLVLVLVGALVAPFTASGTRALLSLSAYWAPLDVRGVSGRLGGSLAIDELRLTLPALDLELRQLTLDWQPRCLVDRRVCISRLHAESMRLAVPEGDGLALADSPATVPAADTGAWQLPVALILDSLQIGTAVLELPGVELRWTQLAASIRTSSSHVSLERAVIDQLMITIAESDADPGAGWALADLADIELPLSMEIGSLRLREPRLRSGELDETLESVELVASGTGHRVRIASMTARHATLGAAEFSAEAVFVAPYQINGRLLADITEVPGLGAEQGLALRVDLRGSLAALGLTLEALGAVPVQGNAVLDLTAPTLPFTLSLEGATPTLETLLGDALTVQRWALVADGDTEQQSMTAELETTVRDLPALRLQAVAEHRLGDLQLEALQIEDAAGSQLRVQGNVGYGEETTLALSLDSDGIVLPPLHPKLQGSVKGALDLSAAAGAQGWRIAIQNGNLEGEIAGKPLVVRGYAALDSEFSAGDSDLTVEAMGANLRVLGGVALSEQAPDDAGTANLLATLQLSALSRFVPDLQGSVALVLRQTGTLERARIQFDGAVSDLVWPGGSAALLAIEGRAAISAELDAEATLRVPQLDLGDKVLQQIALAVAVQGNRQTLSLASDGLVRLDLALAGEGDADAWRGALEATTVGTPLGDWVLAEALDLQWRGAAQGLEVAAHCWRTPGTSLCLADTGRFGEQGAARITLASDLADLEALLPDFLELETAVEVTADIAWSAPGNPSATVDLRMPASQFTVVEVRRDPVSFTWDGLDLRATLVDQVVDLAVQVQGGGAEVLRADAQVDLAGDAAIRGSLELSELDIAALGPLVPELALLAGGISASLAFEGALAAPAVTGDLVLRDAQVLLINNPTSLDEMQLRVAFGGNSAVLDGSLVLGGGAAELGGELTWLEAPALTLTMSGQNHLLLYPPDSKAVFSQQLQLTASAAGARLTGQVDVHSGILELQQLPEGSVSLSSDVVLVDGDGMVVSEANPFNVALDLDVRIDDQFRIDAVGFEGRVGGQMNLRQDKDQPLQIFGTVDVRDGRYRAFGQRLLVRRGLISFTGPPTNPQLDVRAERDMRGSTVVAGISITGNANAPVVDFYSQPYMERPELLSYLLRGRGLDRGSNTGVDTSLLMATLGTGLAGSSGVLGQLERASPLRNLEISTEGAEDETQATIGGYVGDRLYVRYGMGLVEPINELTVRLYLMNNLWVEAVSSLQRSVDLFYAFDIDWSE